MLSATRWEEAPFAFAAASGPFTLGPIAGNAAAVAWFKFNMESFVLRNVCTVRFGTRSGARPNEVCKKCTRCQCDM